MVFKIINESFDNGKETILVLEGTPHMDHRPPYNSNAIEGH